MRPAGQPHQAAVSQSIKKLEEEVGAALFARDVHEVSLTEAGRVLADYARRWWACGTRRCGRSPRLQSMKAGSLTIAAYKAAAVYLLPGGAADLRSNASPTSGSASIAPAGRASAAGDGSRDGSSAS